MQHTKTSFAPARGPLSSRSTTRRPRRPGLRRRRPVESGRVIVMRRRAEARDRSDERSPTLDLRAALRSRCARPGARRPTEPRCTGTTPPTWSASPAVVCFPRPPPTCRRASASPTARRPVRAAGLGHRAVRRGGAARRRDRHLDVEDEPIRRSTRSTGWRGSSRACSTSTCRSRLAHLGVHFAPDPSSQQTCSIGGNVANNSGGPHCLADGVTSAHILASRSCCPTAR